MGIISDLKGKRFGRLLVLKLAYVKRSAFWLCECKCGKKIVKQGSQLVELNVRSCGCLRADYLRGKKGKKSSTWKGSKVGKTALHVRLHSKKKKEHFCNFCKQEKRLDLANISQEYKHTLDDWMWLCRECHVRYDNGWIFKNHTWYKVCKYCKKLLEINADNFYKRSTGKWFPDCKKCNLRNKSNGKFELPQIRPIY